MYDIEQLENEWKKYRKKKLKPFIIILFISICLSIAIIFILMNEKIDFGSFTNYFNSEKEISAKEEKLKNDQKKQAILLNQALDRLELKENLIASIEKNEEKLVNILVDVPLLEDSDVPSFEDESEDKPKIQLDIVKSTSVTAYKDVEKRFFQSHEIDDALFLARSYYKKGDYKKAEFWALETNKLDENSEDSLFIFVKSKAKLGHKNEAISILKDYIRMTNSQEGKKLLYSIENNKL